MEEIDNILRKANLLFECESQWEQANCVPFSATKRTAIYSDIISKEIKRIRFSGKYDYHYRSANEEIADLERAIKLLEKNAKELYDSDID